MYGSKENIQRQSRFITVWRNTKQEITAPDDSLKNISFLRESLCV
jgi:hypothetical protein